MSVAGLRAQGLTKRFGTRVAVEDVSLAVGGGEVLALLGPNGAGKTTMLRLLAGLFPPDAGQVTVDGVPVDGADASATRGRIGLLTETPGLWDRLSVRTNLMTHARLQGLDDAETRVDEALALAALDTRAGDAAGGLSKGMKQRLAMARALLHRPRVVLLDEPTSGLDPAAARRVRDIIGRLREEGCAVVVSTHNLAEAERVADRVAVLSRRLLAHDTTAALQAGRSTRLAIEVEGDATPWIGCAAAHGTEARADGARLVCHVGPDDSAAALIARLVTAGAAVSAAVPQAGTLEEIYLALMHTHG